MASARQIAANRRNAHKPCGTVTEEGKRRSSRNALSRGMTGRVLVLRPRIAYRKIRAALLESYAPANAHEIILVDGIAAGYWRSLRARRFETARRPPALSRTNRSMERTSSPTPATTIRCVRFGWSRWRKER
jgi:hypothetical protein